MDFVHFTTDTENIIIVGMEGGIETAKTAAQRRSIDKWDAAHMSYQTVKLRSEVLEAFKAACAAYGDKVNTVLREAIERYIQDHPLPAADQEQDQDTTGNTGNTGD